MIDKLTMQHRIIIATILSFAFFAAYDYFFIPKTQVTPSSEIIKEDANEAPKSDTQNMSKVGDDFEKEDLNTKSTPKASLNNYIATISGKDFEIKIDSLGRIAKYYLNDPRFQNNDNSRLQLIDPELNPKPLEVRFKDKELNDAAFSNSYVTQVENVQLQGETKSLVFSQDLDKLTITKKITFHPSGNYDVKVDLNKPAEYFLTPGFRPNVVIDSFTFHGILVKEADDTKSVIADGDSKGDERFIDSPLIAAVDRYYATLFYDYKDGFDVVVSADKEENPILFIKGKPSMEFSGYIGPKDHSVLKSIDPRLTDTIEYGWFTFIAKPLFLFLSFIHSILGNWGWSIVVMTILIRLVLFPLTYKGMVSMNKLKELSPKIKELQAKYKGEPQKLNAQMMDLYKKHGANPMGGCLPILLQIPIFFAIYRVLSNAIELKSAPWIFWVQDLAAMDPYFILPVLMGATMFLHQRITPTNFTDPMQEKIMKFLPLVFTFFFVTFPAGLTLYWFINNLFSIGQQYYVNNLFVKKKEAHRTQKEIEK